MVAKMATIVDDVTGPQQRHYSKNIPQLATYQKLRGGVPSTLHHPSPPCTTVGV